jgi:hypothetical protein
MVSSHADPDFASDESLMRRELARHRLSARVKKVGRLFGMGRAA